jgi:hypothetical protein
MATKNEIRDFLRHVNPTHRVGRTLPLDNYRSVYAERRGQASFMITTDDGKTFVGVLKDSVEYIFRYQG